MAEEVYAAGSPIIATLHGVPMPVTIGWNQGMTLRDMFAAQALAGYCAVESCWSETPEEVARAAYAVADAMLAARDAK